MYHRSMRWVTKTTWVRIVALFGVYLLVSALWFSLARVSDSNEAVKSIAFLILLVVLPILAMCVATWDGVKEGFSLLWLVAPFVCFLGTDVPVLQRERPHLRGGLQSAWLRGPRPRRTGPLAPFLVSAPGFGTDDADRKRDRG